MEIPIENQNDEKKEFSRKEITIEEKDKALEKLYQKKEFALIQKPPKISIKTVIVSIIISLIFGFLIGFFTSFFLLTGKIIPFLK